MKVLGCRYMGSRLGSPYILNWKNKNCYTGWFPLFQENTISKQVNKKLRASLPAVGTIYCARTVLGFSPTLAVL